MSSANNKEGDYAVIDVGATELGILRTKLNPKTKKLEFWLAKI